MEVMDISIQEKGQRTEESKRRIETVCWARVIVLVVIYFFKVVLSRDGWKENGGDNELKECGELVLSNANV